jgi:hypothetical protein
MGLQIYRAFLKYQNNEQLIKFTLNKLAICNWQLAVTNIKRLSRNIISFLKGDYLCIFQDI